MEQSHESSNRAEQKPPIVDGIVSVNHQAGGRNEMAARVAFLVVMAIVLVVGLVFAANTYSAKRKAEATQEERAAKVENKPAQVGLKRVFETDPPQPQHTSVVVRSANTASVPSADHAIAVRAATPSDIRGIPVARTPRHETDRPRHQAKDLDAKPKTPMTTGIHPSAPADSHLPNARHKRNPGGIRRSSVAGSDEFGLPTSAPAW